jgi:hypothetical protein
MLQGDVAFSGERVYGTRRLLDPLERVVLRSVSGDEGDRELVAWRLPLERDALGEGAGIRRRTLDREFVAWRLRWNRDGLRKRPSVGDGR